MSCWTMRPAGPEPLTWERSMFFSAAMRLARGETRMRPPLVLVPLEERAGTAVAGSRVAPWPSKLSGSLSSAVLGDSTRAVAVGPPEGLEAPSTEPREAAAGEAAAAAD